MSENAERLQAEIDLLERQKQILLVRADVLTKLLEQAEQELKYANQARDELARLLEGYTE